MQGDKRGRRRSRPATTKTSYYNARITPELRTRLEQAAAGNHRSLSDETAERLARSFEDKTLGFGSPQNYAFGRLLADLANRLFVATGRSWRKDPWTHEQFRAGVLRLLDALRPEGEAVQPVLKRYASETAVKLGEQFAGYMLAALDHGVDILAEEAADPYAMIRRDLGWKTSDQRS